MGKSTLMKYLLEQAITESHPKNTPLIASFFFHGRGSPLQKSVLGLFRSLLHQLLDQHPESLSVFTTIFKKKCDGEGTYGLKWEWHQAELQHHLQGFISSLTNTRPVRIYVDALDECGEGAARGLVKFFQRLISGSTHPEFTSLNICFSCRYYPIVSLDSGLAVRVERENLNDIITYVRRELAEGNVDEGEAQLLEKEIVRRAAGVFQWVVVVTSAVLELSWEGRDVDELLEKVRDTPEQLEALYEGVLRNTKPEYRAEALQLMQWVCFAETPLTMEELRCAMAVDADTCFKTLRECLSSTRYVKSDDKMEARVKSLSGGLIEVIGFDSRRIPQFIHQSVKDYLVSGGIRTLEEFSEDGFIGRAQFRLSRSCLRYVSMKEIRLIDLSLDPQAIKHRFPLLLYATVAWVLHAAKADIEGISQEDLLDLLGWPSNEMIQSWTLLYHRLNRADMRCPPLKTTILHVGSRHGLSSAVAALLDRTRADIEATDAHALAPLSLAALWGHERVAQLLLEKGANINPKNANGWTPLLQAAKSGHEAVVRLLLNNGANIEARDKLFSQTPLNWASKEGNEAVVQLLLENGADIETKSGDHRTPLSFGAEAGHDAAVLLLLENGADTENTDIVYGRTPLSWAALNGHVEVVKLLLEKGANVNGKNERVGNRTALYWAAAKGVDVVVQLLIEAGADIDANDPDWGRTALLVAAQGGHEAVVQLLLEAGADIEVKDKVHHRTPLAWASGEGHESVVQLLHAKSLAIVGKKTEE